MGTSDRPAANAAPALGAIPVMQETPPCTIVTRTGRTLVFVGDPSDTYFQGLAAFHNGSPQFEAFVAHNLPPDCMCIDVGANIGLTAVLLAHYCPRGHVYAIEASPRNAAYLRRNLALNGIENCTVVEAAIGSTTGSIAFRETAFGAGSHVIGSQTEQAGAGRVVRLTTLDALFADRPTRIGFIKIDVEGFEPAVISGAARLIERDGCPIFMEFNSWCLQRLHGFNPFVFAGALSSAFKLAHIDKDGALHVVGAEQADGFMYRNIMQQGCVDDILLQLREGVQTPALAEMTKGAEDLRNHQEVERLRARRARLGWLATGYDALLTPDRPAAAGRSLAPTASGPAPSTDKNAEIQMLRGFAILLVLAAHLSITNSLLMNLPVALSNPGWIGVELFFVVSGYLIMQAFARAHLSVRKFALRRVFRIYPLLIFFLLLAAVSKVTCDLLVPAPPQIFSPSWDTVGYQSLAILLSSHPAPAYGVSYANQALWSLSVEVRFYAAMVVLVAVLNLLVPGLRQRRQWLLTIAAAFYLSGVGARILASADIGFAPMEPFIARMYDFIALGVLAALLPVSITQRLGAWMRPWRWPLLVAPVVLVMGLGSAHEAVKLSPAAFHITMIAIGIMFALLVLACTSAPARRQLGPFSVYAAAIGERSYALFLLHLPVFAIVWALGQWLGFDDGYWRWPIFQLVVSAVLLVPLVEAAYRWIELPMIAYGKKLSARNWAAWHSLFGSLPASAWRKA